MLAIIGALVFAIALILDWADAKVSDAFTPQTLLFLGLLFLALHLAGIGSVARWRSYRRR
jgi:hypothetical protein